MVYKFERDSTRNYDRCLNVALAWFLGLPWLIGLLAHWLGLLVDWLGLLGKFRAPGVPGPRAHKGINREFI